MQTFRRITLRPPKIHKFLGRISISAYLAMVVVIIFGANSASAASPISPTNKPTPLGGYENGELPSNLLIRVTPNCQVARASATSLSLMLASAKRRNISVTTRDCYRPLADQIAVRSAWASAGNSACAAAPTTSPTGKPRGTSIHGWGKAVDLGYGGGQFGSAGYRYLKSEAWRYGWNHPGWAEPGGSACPEAWHWEWVGDGGILHAETVEADRVAIVPSSGGHGYVVITGLGAVQTSGDAINYGAADQIPLNWVMVGAAPTHDRKGYWMVGADGGIFSFGNAQFYGSMGSEKLNKPVIGMTATPSGNGYWLVAEDGGIFSFGDAKFFGSMGGTRLNRPVVSMSATPTGNGYWLFAADGGVFSFGDAMFFGSMGGTQLNSPVVNSTSGPDGNGYWMVAEDGGVFSFGDVPFYGSLGNNPPAQPVVGMQRTPSGHGYWILTAKGAVSTFGNVD